MTTKEANRIGREIADAARKCVENLGNELLFNGRARSGIHPSTVDAQQLATDCKRLTLQLMFFGILDAEYAAGDERDRDRSCRAVGATAIDLLRRAAKDPGECCEYRLYGQFRLATMAVPGLEWVTLVRPHTDSLVSRGSIRNAVLLEAAEALGLLDDPACCRFPYRTEGTELLGRVTERLLSYSGQIMTEEMCGLKRRDRKTKPEDASYFVPPSQLDDFTEEERVKDAAGNLYRVPPGRFLYRLSGKLQEKQASYYTPHELRQCLVKYALKDDVVEGDMPADEILKLTVMEPAVGAGAILMEAVNQLSAAYLEKKQKELGDTIPPDRYPYELARVKKYITLRNVYCVDMDRFALEVAQANLFLNMLQDVAA